MLSSARRDYPVSESIGHLVNLVHRKLQPLLEARVRDVGLSYGTWFFLRALWERDGVSQTELAERVGASQPTTLAALRALRDRGYVRLADDRDDARRWRVMLTAKGRALRETLIPRVATINGVVLRGLSDREADELRRMLRVIQANAERDLAELRASQSKTTPSPRARNPRSTPRRKREPHPARRDAGSRSRRGRLLARPQRRG